MSENELRRWMRAWDDRIERWVRELDEGAPPAAGDLGLGPIRDAWLRANERLSGEEVTLALPEPWAGNPLADGLQGVAIYHNPGGALAVQLHPRGSLVARLREGARFSELACTWTLAQKTTEWWLRVAEFVARATGGPISRKAPAILGMDLLPWHSTERGPLVMDDATAEHLRAEVFLPARHAAERARLRTVEGAPVVFACHEWVRDAIHALGAKVIAAASDESWDDESAQWPRSFRGERTQRRFELLRLPLPGGDLHLLVTWAPGSNFPPGRAFDPIVRSLGVEIAG